MTIRTRLTIWYGVTFMLLIAVAGVVVWWQVDASLRASTGEALRIHAIDVADALRQSPAAIHTLEPPFPGIFTALADPATGSIDAGAGTPKGLPICHPEAPAADSPTMAQRMPSTPCLCRTAGRSSRAAHWLESTAAPPASPSCWS